MTAYAAFLRGVNLGKRTVKSADLKAAFLTMGFADARPLIASGNVVFSADQADEARLARAIEAGLKQAFGFDIGTVLRSRAELQAMIAAAPFAGVDPAREAKFYVAMLAEPVARELALPYGVDGNFEVLSLGERDVFIVAWKMENGRYGEGLDRLDTLYGKQRLITMRNWNTILKAAA